MTTDIAQGPVDVTVRLHDLPPEGSALRKLGARLAELLDEDQWVECERRLFEIADEQQDALEDKADVASKALRRAWQLGQTYWQQADSEYTSQHRKADETQAKFQTLVDETRAAILVQPNAIGQEPCAAVCARSPAPTGCASRGNNGEPT